MNSKNLKLLLSITLCLLSYTFVMGGNNADKKPDRKLPEIYAAGYISINDVAVANATIKLYSRNEVIQVIQSDQYGEFFLKLPIDDKCTIQIIKDGCISKIISIDTKIDPDRRRVPIFEFTVSLLLDSDVSEGADRDFLDFPAALVAYNTDEKELTYSRKYQKFAEQEYNKIVMKNIR